MKNWFVACAVMGGVFLGATSSAFASAEITAEQEMPPFYESGVYHFQGTVALAADDVPMNEAFGVEYSDCKARQAGGGWLRPDCAAAFDHLGFYLLHTAYFWDAATGTYLPAASLPTDDYKVESASLRYDPQTHSVTYDLALRYLWTCRGSGCMFAPVIVASLVTNVVDYGPSTLAVYDDALVRGAYNYLLTGDGQERYTSVNFNSANAYSGASAIEVNTRQDAQTGSHWKLMLFANGSSAGYAGIDLSAYSKLEFMVATNRPGGVTLQGAFGTGEDSATRNLGAFVVTPQWQKRTLDLTGLNVSDINTLLWVYLHKASNPFDLTGVSVYIDDVRFVE